MYTYCTERGMDIFFKAHGRCWWLGFMFVFCGSFLVFFFLFVFLSIILSSVLCTLISMKILNYDKWEPTFLSRPLAANFISTSNADCFISSARIC